MTRLGRARLEGVSEAVERGYMSQTAHPKQKRCRSKAFLVRIVDDALLRDNAASERFALLSPILSFIGYDSRILTADR